MLIIQFLSKEKNLSGYFLKFLGMKKIKIYFQSKEKILVNKFHSMEKMLILLFSCTYFCSMKLYERV